jgi:hypothetical protein
MPAGAALVGGYCSEQAASAHRQLFYFYRMMLLDFIHSD